MNDPLREQVVKLLQGGQAHLTFDEVIKNFPAKFRRSFRKQTGSWISAAAAIGTLIALAPMRKKKVYVDARSRRKGDKKLVETGLGLAAIKLVGNLARPVITEFVKNRFFYSRAPARGRK